MFTALVCLALVPLALMAWVRLAPHPAERAHQPVDLADQAEMRYVKDNGIQVVTPLFETTAPDLMQALEDIALATPRTRVLAQSDVPMRTTFVTRSLLWGFPDYTTVEAVQTPEGSRLKIYARQRFGNSDLGVNAARVDGWLEALSQAGQGAIRPGVAPGGVVQDHLAPGDIGAVADG